MPFVTASIPIWIRQIQQDNGASFYASPLFFPDILEKNARFDRVMDQIRQKLKTTFTPFHLSRGKLHRWFWLNHPGPFKYFHFSVDFPIGKTWIKGEIPLVHFSVKNFSLLYFPTFQNGLLAIDGSESDWGDRILEIIRQFLQKEKKSLGKNFDLNPYLAPSKGFLTTLEESILVTYPPFFEKDTSDPFARMVFQASKEFNGEEEIKAVAADWNALFPNQLSRAYQAEEQVDRLQASVFGLSNNPLALVGPEGCGRHTLLQEALYRYLQSEVDAGLKLISTHPQVPHLWLLDPTRVISGMSIVGQWQRRFESIIQYILKPNPTRSIADKLVVDNPVALLRIGQSSQNDLTLSKVLKPYLEDRRLQVILIATPDEWKLIQEKDRGLADLFQVLRIAPSNEEKTFPIALKKRRKLEQEYDCRIGLTAMKTLFVLHRNYFRNQALPGSILKRLQHIASKYRNGEIHAETVMEEFSFSSGLKPAFVDPSNPFDPQEMRAFLEGSLVGQPDAVEALAGLINTLRARLHRPGKPIATFLFTGPTGVGKTQAAKVLCEYLLENPKSLIRIDMNEYLDRGAVHRLVGDFSEPEGVLVSRVRYQPFGVLLLDEIEKAHPSVHDLLLQIMDDGRLTDGRGRLVDFSNIILILTSNLGAREADMQVGFRKSPHLDDGLFLKALRNFFRPEFLNRIDKTVIFRLLEVEHILDIARLQIRELLQRDGFVRRTTILDISTEALEWVARRGYNSRMGGRSLKRQIESDLTTLSADQLLRSREDQPILMRIGLQHDRLAPEITPISFAQKVSLDWLPQAPSGHGSTIRLFNKQLEKLESLDSQLVIWQEKQGAAFEKLVLSGAQKGENLNWQYYYLKEQIAEKREELQRAMLSLSTWDQKPVIPYRLRRARLPEYGGPRHHALDFFFQKDAFQELKNQHAFNNFFVEENQSPWITLDIQVRLLHHFTHSLLQKGPGRVRIEIKSAIQGKGEAEITFQSRIYQRLLEHLGFAVRQLEGPELLEAEGLGLETLLQGEQGLHLYLQYQENPLPLWVRILEGQAESQADQALVIRLYNMQHSTTDLRTGLITDASLSPSEFLLLLFAGMHTPA